MIELFEFEVEDSEGMVHQYKANALAGTVAATIFVKLLKMLSGKGAENITSLGMAIISNLDAEDAVNIARRLLGKEVLRDNKPVNFDQDYRGNLNEMIKAVFEIVKFNYKDFSELGNFLAEDRE